MSRDPQPAHSGVGADRPEASTQALGIMQTLHVLAASFAASSSPTSVQHDRQKLCVQLSLSWYIPGL